MSTVCHTGDPLGIAPADVDHREVTVPVAGGRMPTLVATPKQGRGPAVVVICDMFGRSGFYESLAGGLAGEGFTVACPELYFREGAVAAGDLDGAYARWAAWDEPRALDDIAATLRALYANDLAEPGAHGTIGFCVGGTLALNFAARDGDVATVCFYGFPAGSTRARVPAKPPFDELDMVRGPILGLWGEDDPSVGMATVRRYAKVAGERGIPLEHVIYPGARHGFMAACAREPTEAGLATARNAWQRTVRFLHSALMSGNARVT